MMIQNNIIHAAHKYAVKKLLFLGSSCIYPKEAPQPLKEEYLLTGLLEQTNEPYAIAKISGIKMCESYYRQYGSNFISVMPTNLYGPNDNYDLEKSHVLPALIRKMHLGKCLENNNWEAILKDLDKNPVKDITESSEKDQILGVLKEFGIQYIEHEPAASNQQPVTVKLWGTGKIYREFLHVNDMADACIHIMEHVEAEKLYTEMGQTHINIGTGIDLTIKDLAETIKKITGFNGTIEWDDTKPDGTYKKQLDTTLLKKLDWNFKIGLEEGISTVYQNYISQSTNQPINK
jgi:GDP-L-fucose synthase